MSENINKDKYLYSFCSVSSSENKISAESQALLELLPHHAFLIQNNSIYANQHLRQLIGLEHCYTFKDIINSFHQEDIKTLKTLWSDNTRQDQKNIRKEFRIKNISSQKYEWFLLLNTYQPSDGSIHCLTTLTNIQRQITISEKTKNQLNTQTEMLDASVDFIYVVHPNGYIQHMNKSSRLAIHNDQQININKIKWIDLLPQEVHKKALSAFHKASQGHIAKFTGITVVQGATEYWDNTLTPIHQENSSESSILCVSRNITAQKKAENLLRISSEHDELTGLLNRRGLKKAIKPIFKQALKNHEKVGLILLDLDHFKHVNDTLGHSAGDYFLKALSKRMQNILKQGTTIARLGGDEFAIILQNIQDQEQLLSRGKKIIQLLDTSISYKGKVLTGGMSLGCAIYPDDATGFSTLLQCADTALSDIKSRGRGGIRYFGKDLLYIAQNKVKQIETARLILRNHLIRPFYQPKINLYTNELVGVEALLRWYDEYGNLHTPDTVQEAFNDFELSSQISAEMQFNIFNDIKRWKSEGKKVVPVAINVSPVEFLRDNYAETLLKRLQTAKVSPEHIEVEITEHLFADRGVEYVVRALKKLREAGIKIALDDFGTGHSSLSHLRDLPVDIIKIDYSFVERMTTESSIRAIVDGLIKLAPLLSMKIIAEGIENQEQLNLLKKMGCHEGQGYFFNEAMDQLDVNHMLNYKIISA